MKKTSESRIIPPYIPSDLTPSSHTALSELSWTASGHTGPSSSIAFFNSTGNASSITLNDFVDLITLEIEDDFARIDSLSLVAFSNDYNDLINKPTLLTLGSIPGAALGIADAGSSSMAARADHVHPMPNASQVGADPAGTASSLLSTHVAAANPHPVYPLITSLATVAFSGLYSDLSGLPSLITSHSALSNLEWSLSAHTSTSPLKIAAFSSSNAAVEWSLGLNLTELSNVLKTTDWFSFVPQSTPPVIPYSLWSADASVYEMGTLVWSYKVVLDDSIDIGGVGIEQSSIRIDSSIIPTKIRSSSLGGDPVLMLLHHHGLSTHPTMKLSRSKSNGALHSAVENNDILGEISFIGWSTSSTVGYLPAASIRAKVNGTVSSTAMPGSLEFLTSPSGNKTPEIGAYLLSNKVFGIETALELGDGSSASIAPINKTRIRSVAGVISISYNGGAYSPLAPSVLNDLSNVSGSPATNDVLTWTGSTWEPMAPSTAPVTSVFGRTGVITAQSGDYTVGQVTGAEATANKGVASGYASLDISTKIPTAQLATGTANSTTWLRGDRTWTSLAAIATSGSYSDLSGAPFIPTVLNDLTDVSGTPSSGQVLTWSGATWSPANLPTQITPDIYQALTADQARLNNNSDQQWFNTGQVSLLANSLYRFDGEIYLTAGTASHGILIGFSASAPISFIRYKTVGHKSLEDATATPVQGSWRDTLTPILAAPANTTGGSFVRVSGILRTAASNIIFTPLFAFSAAPGGSPLVKRGTYIQIHRLGADTASTRGTWT